MRPPNGTKSYDYWLLKQASLARRYYIGTFYVPSKNLYSPVFRRIGKADPKAFLTITARELRDSYKMVCIKGCGQCCERNSNAVIFEEEARELGIQIRDKPSFEVELVDGSKLKVYRLDTRRNGQCVFYNRRRKTCSLGRNRPILCVIHYCSAFAERVENGRKVMYVKVSGKELGNGLVEMKFERVSNEEWEEIVRMVKNGVNVWRAVAEILRKRNLGKA
ncbi:hypothetical protein EYM_01605 [Ignicoccus islandicus DSM 13165]|uniref:YkgJ family cysteine cluster protein n=1 Tax=Ignicoccus islandicus DSM 13165 TaxID=940295 RepID=A0A0U2VDV9_9CREN|nr:YkgJ family cysteine cluster protein [Ignicoccus islandicus]ALU12226.1 hypothetical protein EYM_01605 [Ignicoccus islandicus DSM 13165]